MLDWTNVRSPSGNKLLSYLCSQQVLNLWKGWTFHWNCVTSSPSFRKVEYIHRRHTAIRRTRSSPKYQNKKNALKLTHNYSGVCVLVTSSLRLKRLQT